MDPYAPPQAVEPAVPPLPVAVRVDDPTRLAMGSIGLLAASVLVDLTIHLGATFFSGGSSLAGLMDQVEFASGWLVLAQVVVFLCWMYRILWNARRVAPDVMRVSPGWGVGSYFVPIANLWVPAKALIQASRASGTSGGWVIAWWIASMGMLAAILLWFLWIYVGAEFTPEMAEGSELATVGWFEHLTVAADLGIAALEVPMVVGLTRRQREWAAASRAT